MLQLKLPQAEQPHLSHPVPTGWVFHHFDYYYGTPLDTFQQVCVPKTGVSTPGGVSEEQRCRGITPLKLLSMLLLMQPSIQLDFG